MFNKTAVLILAALLSFSSADAGVISYVKTVKKIVSATQTPDDVKVFAVADAKREIVEQAGTYIETNSVVENGVLKKDDIRAIAAGILKTEIIKVLNTMEQGQFAIEVTVRAEVDTSTLKEQIDSIKGNEKAMDSYRSMEKRLTEQLEKIAELERKSKELETQLALAKSDKDKKAVEKKMDDARNSFAESKKALEAVEWFDKGYGLWDSEKGIYTDSRQAEEYFSKAIECDPGYSEAYNARGMVFDLEEKYDKAIKDYTKAVETDPENADAYANRCLAYTAVDKFSPAIKDCSQAIMIDDKFAFAYAIRGEAYLLAGQKKQGCADVEKGCQLGDCTSLEWAKEEGYCR